MIPLAAAAPVRTGGVTPTWMVITETMVSLAQPRSGLAIVPTFTLVIITGTATTTSLKSRTATDNAWELHVYRGDLEETFCQNEDVTSQTGRQIVLKGFRTL